MPRLLNYIITIFKIIITLLIIPLEYCEYKKLKLFKFYPNIYEKYMRLSLTKFYPNIYEKYTRLSLTKAKLSLNVFC